MKGLPAAWGRHLPLTKNPNCVYLTDCLLAGSGTDWLTVNLSSRCTAEGNRIFFCNLRDALGFHITPTSEQPKGRCVCALGLRSWAPGTSFAEKTARRNVAPEHWVFLAGTGGGCDCYEVATHNPPDGSGYLANLPLSSISLICPFVAALKNHNPPPPPRASEPPCTRTAPSFRGRILAPLFFTISCVLLRFPP